MYELLTSEIILKLRVNSMKVAYALLYIEEEKKKKKPTK